MWILNGPARLFLAMLIAAYVIWDMSQIRYDVQISSYALTLLLASAAALVLTASSFKRAFARGIPEGFGVDEQSVRITLWLLLAISAIGHAASLINVFVFRS